MSTKRWHQETRKWDLHDDGNSNSGKSDLKLLTSQVLEWGKCRLDSYINRDLAAHVLTIDLDGQDAVEKNCMYIDLTRSRNRVEEEKKVIELGLCLLEKKVAKATDKVFFNRIARCQAC